MGKATVAGMGVLLVCGCSSFIEASTDGEAAVSTGLVDASSTGAFGEGSGSTGRDPTGRSSTSSPSLETSGGESSSTGDGSTGLAGSSSSSSSTGEEPPPLPGCDNGVVDINESDVDCGGACAPCEAGQSCGWLLDCGSASCVAGTCIASELVVWLDGASEETVHQAETCDLPAMWDGDTVQCWQNRGLAGDALVVPAGDDVLGTPDGVVVSGSYLLIDSPFEDQPLNDVWIVLVSTVRGNTNSFDLNLADPAQSAAGRYSAHLPWGGNGRLFFDPSVEHRLQSEPNLVSLDEAHLFGLLNSEDLDLRAIQLDGEMVVSAKGAVMQETADLSLGRGAALAVQELRIYTPAPAGAERLQIEGELACKWDIRDQLPEAHPFFDAMGDSDVGCPAPER